MNNFYHNCDYCCTVACKITILSTWLIKTKICNIIMRTVFLVTRDRCDRYSDSRGSVRLLASQCM